MRRLLKSRRLHPAPALLGAVFLAFAALLASCERKSTESAPASAESTPAATRETPKPVASPDNQPGNPPGKVAEPSATAATPGSSAPSAPPSGPEEKPTSPAPAGLRFVSFNIENWLTMDRYYDGKKLPGRPKPEKEKDAVVSIIAGARPDVLGVCEIGTREDLADLQKRLAAAGLDLPNTAYCENGTDEVRHLALLSRLPIVATHQPGKTEYRLGNQSFGIQRGILDVTVAAGPRRYRILGIHFKSKRPVREADQEQMRRHEAALLREHIESIFAADPEARLIVHGDFNDTKRNRAVRAVQGTFNTPEFLTAPRFEDSRGHVWTQFWSYQDVYSRFDFVMLSRNLLPELDFKASRVLDPENWHEASDHRALLVVFR